MEDARIWEFEERLWHGGREVYEGQVDEACLMALPTDPWLLEGRGAIDAVSDTPRWKTVEFSERKVSRPQEGLIVIAYRVRAARAAEGGDGAYEALCTSTLRRIAHEEWRVVQHQQTPVGAAVSRR